MRNIGKRPKAVLTIGGWVKYRRSVLFPVNRHNAEILTQVFGIQSIAPLDEVLGTDNLPFKITEKMMLRIAKEGIESASYEEASRRFLESWNISVSADEIKKVVDYVGGIVFQDDCSRALEAKETFRDLCQKHQGNDILYLEMDGAMLPSRERNGKTIWIENKLAVAFHSEDIRYWTNTKGEQCHKILKRDFCSYVGCVEEFQYHLLALALRNHCDTCSHVVMISDGAAWIGKLKENFFPNATHILDLCHLKENVARFAAHIFSENAEKSKTWTTRINQQLENGACQDVLRLLKPYQDVKTPDGVVNLYTYISNHMNCIHYPEYKARGFFVGSGVIESSHRTVMQKRMKLAGMRWNKSTAQGVLALRCRNESGKWDEVIQLVKQSVHSK